MAAEYHRAAALDDVTPGESLGVIVEGHRICLANVEGHIYAVRDNCTHQDFPLSEGMVDEEECSIECGWHGARFDLRTGAVLALPAIKPVKTYEVRVDEGQIYVAID